MDEKSGILLTKEVGYRVRTLREKKGLRQQDLAKLSGVSQSVISRIELGRANKTSLQSIFMLHAHLNAKLSDILQITTKEFDEKFKIKREKNPDPLLKKIFSGVPTPKLLANA